MNQYTLVQGLGITVLIIGITLSKLAVSRMAKVVRVRWAVGFKSIAVDRQTIAVIRAYRATYGDGPLLRNLLFSYGIAGIGAVMFVCEKFVGNKP